ncbi:hypothetical protein [Sporosarcina sp. ITBMC105]
MKSKLEKLFDDESFGTDAIDHELGIMIKDGVPVDYLILKFKKRWDVYLNVYDEGMPPFRNILVKGSSRNKEVAKSLATRKLDKEFTNPVH